MRGMGERERGASEQASERRDERGERRANDEGIVSEDSVDRVMRKPEQKEKIAEARSGECVCVCKLTEKTIERQ